MFATVFIDRLLVGGVPSFPKSALLHPFFIFVGLIPNLATLFNPLYRHIQSTRSALLAHQQSVWWSVLEPLDPERKDKTHLLYHYVAPFRNFVAAKNGCAFDNDNHNFYRHHALWSGAMVGCW
jgi:hypothetical protein